MVCLEKNKNHSENKRNNIFLKTKKRSFAWIIQAVNEKTIEFLLKEQMV